MSASTREEEREAEHDEQQLGHQVEHGDEDPVAVERRAPHEPDARRRPITTPTPTTTSHGLCSSDSHCMRRAEVVRQEERRERDHDQVVEEERPAGQEAGEVVEGATDEGGGAAGLRDRGRALGVRERDDQEERADDREHLGRQAERVQGDDPEREVDRGGDLAVGDREERGRVEDPLEPGIFRATAGGYSPAVVTVTVTVAGVRAGRGVRRRGDEEDADQVAEAAAVPCGLDEDRDADPDRDETEERRQRRGTMSLMPRVAPPPPSRGRARS